MNTLFQLLGFIIAFIVMIWLVNYQINDDIQRLNRELKDIYENKGQE